MNIRQPATSTLAVLIMMAIVWAGCGSSPKDKEPHGQYVRRCKEFFEKACDTGALAGQGAIDAKGFS